MEVNKLVKVFEEQLNLTEEGLLKLTNEKKKLVINVTTDTGFKQARKERTEQNKLLEKIDRLAIDGKNEVDEARATLKSRVADIYFPIVSAFDAEDDKRKQAAAIEADKEKKRLQLIRDEIENIRVFAKGLLGKNSEDLSGIIEAVDLIDISENFAELTQEAMSVQKETLSILNTALASAIQQEQIDAEREELEEKNRLSDLKAKTQDRLNNLKMIPSTMFGKSSDDLQAKIDSLDNFVINEEEFGEFTEEAAASSLTAVEQLKRMLAQQLRLEESEAGKESENESTDKAPDEVTIDNSTPVASQPRKLTSSPAPSNPAKEFVLANEWRINKAIHEATSSVRLYTPEERELLIMELAISVYMESNGIVTEAA